MLVVHALWQGGLLLWAEDSAGPLTGRGSAHPFAARYWSRAPTLAEMFTVPSSASWMRSAAGLPLQFCPVWPPAIDATPRSWSPRTHASACVMNDPLL